MDSYNGVGYEPIDESKENVIKKCLRFITKTQTLFYYCALISSWDDRSWYFLIGIYLVVMDPNNLLLIAIFGFLSSGCVLIFGSVIGSWIDKTPRLKAMFIILTIRNLSTFICSVCLCLVLFYYDQVIISDNFPNVRLLSKVIMIVFGVAAHTAGLVNNTTLSRDWLPIYCLKDSHLLSEMATRCRLIDMVCKIVVPVIIGQIITFAGKTVAAIVFSVQVMMTLILLCALLNVIYKRMPRLHYREDEENEDMSENSRLLKNEDGRMDDSSPKQSSTNKRCTKCLIFIDGWLVYFREPIMLAGLALALLYMTVLSFDSVTIGYAISQGVSESVLSFYNAGAAITGIIGALLFPRVIKFTNVVFTGIISLGLQFLGLMPCVVSVWAPGSPFDMLGNITYSSLPGGTTITPVTVEPFGSLSVILLMSGIIASRVGLWMYDLTANQLLIETVMERNRGKVETNSFLFIAYILPLFIK